jgi:hypothetical protein
MRKYGIRVELDERFDPDDVRLDLQTNRLHPLHKHDLHLAVSPCGARSPSLPSICGARSLPPSPLLFSDGSNYLLVGASACR